MPQDQTEFHIVLQGRVAASVVASPTGDLLPTADGNALPLPLTFDEAYANLARLPRLFIEPDGAFLWMGLDPSGREHWRLDGCLYDSGKQLQYVELKGHCPSSIWSDLTSALAATNANAMVQLVRSGRFVSIERFVSYLT
jgi:hypothetical protein